MFTGHRYHHNAHPLPGQDSNLERQDQNLVCYHYTTGQSLPAGPPASLNRCQSDLRSWNRQMMRGRGRGLLAEA